MDDKIIVIIRMKNNSFVNTMSVYESGIVKARNETIIKKINIVNDIVNYIENTKKHGFEKSNFDDKCEVEYNGVIYNSGIMYSNIELMIRNNQNIEAINKVKNKTRIKQKHEQNIKEQKEETIKKNKNKIIEIYNNRNVLDIESLPENKNIITFESINFSLSKKNSFKLGESRVLSKYIDIPDNVEYPEELEFLAQINLNEFSKYDKNGILPSSGSLYFFQGSMIDDKYYECGKVIYSDDSNFIRKEVFIYNEEMDLELGINDIKSKIDKYSADNDIENKIMGIYSDPQMNESDILKVSNEYIILLQLGNDIYGEGVITFLIKENDLKNKIFDNVIYTYSQT